MFRTNLKSIKNSFWDEIKNIVIKILLYINFDKK